MTAMPFNTDYGTLTGSPHEVRQIASIWQTQDIPPALSWLCEATVGPSHGEICSRSTDELVHQLVYNPALGFSPSPRVPDCRHHRLVS